MCVQKIYLYFATCFRFLFFNIHINVDNTQTLVTVRLVINLLRVSAILSAIKDRLKIHRLLRRSRHFYVQFKHKACSGVVTR